MTALLLILATTASHELKCTSGLDTVNGTGFPAGTTCADLWLRVAAWRKEHPDGMEPKDPPTFSMRYPTNLMVLGGPSEGSSESTASAARPTSRYAQIDRLMRESREALDRARFWIIVGFVCSAIAITMSCASLWASGRSP